MWQELHGAVMPHCQRPITWLSLHVEPTHLVEDRVHRHEGPPTLEGCLQVRVVNPTTFLRE